MIIENLAVEVSWQVRNALLFLWNLFGILNKAAWKLAVILEFLLSKLSLSSSWVGYIPLFWALVFSLGIGLLLDSLFFPLFWLWLSILLSFLPVP